MQAKPRLSHRLEVPWHGCIRGGRAEAAGDCRRSVSPQRNFGRAACLRYHRGMSFLLRAGLAGAAAWSSRAAPPRSRPAPRRRWCWSRSTACPPTCPAAGACRCSMRSPARACRRPGSTPSYPTLTFPNHYTLVTGLRPDRHGIVHNNIRDATLGRFVSKQASARDGRWWGGEPIWATLQRQGGIAATMFWPGSEAEIAGQRPRYWKPLRRHAAGGCARGPGAGMAGPAGRRAAAPGDAVPGAVRRGLACGRHAFAAGDAGAGHGRCRAGAVARRTARARAAATAWT